MFGSKYIQQNTTVKKIGKKLSTFCAFLQIFCNLYNTRTYKPLFFRKMSHSTYSAYFCVCVVESIQQTLISTFISKLRKQGIIITPIFFNFHKQFKIHVFLHKRFNIFSCCSAKAFNSRTFIANYNTLL